MILLDKPYVSNLLKETIEKNKFKIVDNAIPSDLVSTKNFNLVSEQDAINHIKENPNTAIYSNSENAISWIEKNLAFTNLPEKISLFKNKITFRELIQDIYPNYYFKGFKFEDIDKIKLDTIPFPFIIKPAVGFFSMGVHKVDSKEEWQTTVSQIKKEMKETSHLYPDEVLNTSDFIIEECIIGDEFAIDCYFDNEGKPVVLNIMEHIFSSGKDVSDRIYFTGKKVIEKHINNVYNFLNKIAELANVKNFPTHIEVRITQEGTIIPIEVNPMRFGGWCSSVDMAWFAYGINEYEYFLNNKKPDWTHILAQKNNQVNCIVILDNNSGINSDEIKEFDYELLLADFKNPLDLRKTNFREYPVFGLLFVESESENSDEISHILKSNLKKYIKL